MISLEDNDRYSQKQFKQAQQGSADQKKNDRDSKTETEKDLEREKETADFYQISKANDKIIPNGEQEEEQFLNELKDISIISIKKDSSPIEEEDLDEHSH